MKGAVETAIDHARISGEVAAVGFGRVLNDTPI